MGSKLINHTLKNITAGVSQQADEMAFESQVEEMINCMPSLARGVLRRNPISSSLVLLDSEGNPIAINGSTYVYSYDRGTGNEQYLVVIDSSATLRVYNINTLGNNSPLIEQYVSYFTTPNSTPRESLDSVTIGDHTFITNSTKTPVMATTTGTQEDKDKWEKLAFYWIKKTTGVVTSQKTTGDSTTSDSGSKMEGYTYKLNGVFKQGYKATTPYTDTKEQLTAEQIATALVTGQCKDSDGNLVDAYPNNTSLGTTYASEGVFVVKSGDITEWEFEDSFGNNASLGVWKEIDDANKLPAKLPKTVGGISMDGFTVRVSGGTSSKDDDYFLKYDTTKETWTETRNPYATYGILPDVMPHVLYGLTDGSGNRVFTVDTYKKVSDDGTTLLDIAWKNRLVGDEITNEAPSFINKKISRIFFHKNRLGFLTVDGIVLSSTGDYGNFFGQTVQEVLDDDPIDIAISTTNVTALRDVVTTTGTLILFSDRAQFTLSSGGNTLTPDTANVETLSNYTFNKSTRPIAVGNKIYFTSISGGYAQLFSYKIADNSTQITEATPLTIHIPSFIPSYVSKILGHDVLGYTFIQEGGNSKELIVLTSTSIGEKELQNAFHKWSFNNYIIDINIVHNSLYILFDNGMVGTIKLEVAGDISTIKYKDIIFDSNGVFTESSYPSIIKFKQLYWRDGEERGTSRGRLQIRTIKYTATSNSYYETQLSNPTLAYLTPDEDNIGKDVTYNRVFKNDNKVTVMANSSNVSIVFRENEDHKDKGFELATLNIEMLYHQRSARV